MARSHFSLTPEVSLLKNHTIIRHTKVYGKEYIRIEKNEIIVTIPFIKVGINNFKIYMMKLNLK